MLQKLKENKRFVAFLLVFATAFWFVNIISTIQHESAHREICKSFGGENVTTYTNHSFGGMSGETYCSNTTSDRGLELHMKNEIVGYHVTALIYAFFLGIFLLVGYWELRK